MARHSPSAALSPTDFVKGYPLIILMAMIIISQSIMAWLIHHPTIPHKPVEHHLSPQTNASVLILAAVPRDANHLAALWTIMECFSFGFDMVLISSSKESQPIMEMAVQKMYDQELHHNIQTIYTTNDRYDVGLWCDALEYLKLRKFKYFVLLNDSVFALRRFRAVLDFLQTDKYNLVGLTYSHLGGSYWVESFFRGFSLKGIQKLRQHSCIMSPYDASYAYKRAIVDHHEIALTALFEPSERTGLFSADPPELYPSGRGWSNKTWTTLQNIMYWKEILIETQRFPVGKVKMPRMVPNLTSPILNQCMEKVEPSYFEDLYDENSTKNII